MVTGITRLAIQSFKKVASMERKLEIARVESNSWCSKVPEEDMDHYMRVTENIQKKEDRKLETEIRRKFKRR